MYCKYCGIKNEDGAKFCYNCGTEFEPEEEFELPELPEQPEWPTKEEPASVSQNEQPASPSAAQPAPQTTQQPTPQPAPQASAQPAQQPAYHPAPQTTQPVSQVAPQPAYQPAPQPAPQPTYQPAPQVVQQPVYQPAPQSVVRPSVIPASSVIPAPNPANMAANAAVVSSNAGVIASNTAVATSNAAVVASNTAAAAATGMSTAVKVLVALLCTAVIVACCAFFIPLNEYGDTLSDFILGYAYWDPDMNDVYHTVEGFEAAFNERDLSGMLDYFPPSFSSYFRMQIGIADLIGGFFGFDGIFTEEMLGTAFGFALQNSYIDIEVLDISFNTAKTEAYVVINFTADGKTQQDTLTLMHISGNWYLSEEYFDMEELYPSVG